MKQLVITLSVGIGLTSLAFGANLDLTQRYLLLATTKTSTMQKELGQASAAGYRIIAGSPTSGEEMALILEKVATLPNNYEYILLATTRLRNRFSVIGLGTRFLRRTPIGQVQILPAG